MSKEARDMKLIETYLSNQIFAMSVHAENSTTESEADYRFGKVDGMKEALKLVQFALRAIEAREENQAGHLAHETSA